MKKFLLLTLAVASVSAYGQGLRMGSYYHRQQKQKTELRQGAIADSNGKTAGKGTPKPNPQKAVYVDQTMKVSGDNIYRYVFAYNKSMERSSETIYRKHFNGVEWSDEEFYNRGVYTYEYDAQGRIVSKTVKYDKNSTEFDSYNVSVSYEDGYTVYSHYLLGDTEPYHDMEWSFWKNGKLRHYTKFNGYESDLRGVYYSISFDENGICDKITNNYYESKHMSGYLNDSTITHYNTYEGYESLKSIEHYVYNPQNGKLTEYKTWGGNDENRKYEYVYDAQDRISAIRKYYDSDDDDASVDYPVASAKATKRENSMKEPEWRLEYNETYTYFNDEVYGIGNPWHDIFGMDGPLTNRHLVDDDYEPGMPWVEDLTFNRDVNGKLLSVVSTQTEEDEVVDETTYDVDANGHITKEYAHFKETWGNGEYNEETTTTDYNWQGDVLTNSRETSTNKGSYGGGNTYVRDYSYTYGEGTFGYKRVSSDNDGSSSEVNGNITKLNKGFKIVESDKSGKAIYIQEVQTEDVSFIRPNLIRDYEGFSTDSTIVVSVKDRVVAYSDMGYSYSGNTSGWRNFEYRLGDVDTYANTCGNTYFSVSHDGDNTICSNAKGMPVFVLQGDRLLKERIYEELYYNASTEVKATSRASNPGAVYAYKEITYSYDENGLVNGQTVTTVDENGTKVDETKVEVVYNPASGIEAINASTGKGLSLSGRTLGVSNGSFSVYTLGGTMLAGDAQSFQFQQGGTYIIRSNGGKAIKVSVK